MYSVDYTTVLKMLCCEPSFEGGQSSLLFIVHRLRFIPQFFDQVVVMEEGRVIEYDEPGKLLSDSSSLFQQMTEAENGSEEYC